MSDMMTPPGTLETLQDRRQRLSLDPYKTDGTAEIDAVEGQIAHLLREREREALAIVERTRRDHEMRMDRQTELLRLLEEDLELLELERDELLATVASTSAPSQANLDQIYLIARQSHRLAQDLFGLTGDPYFHREWLLRSQLRAHARSLPHLYMVGMPKPTVPMPWQPLVDEYCALNSSSPTEQKGKS